VSERGSQLLTASVVAGGFVMGEGPRWREGRFWFSDIFDGRVYSVGHDGALRLEVTIDRPSGLGWLPDGSLLIATLARTVSGRLAGPARVVRVDRSGHHVVIDVTEEGNIGFNDMVVGPDGRAYVNVYRGLSAEEDEIWLVRPDGSHVCVADALAHPNGMVITPDRATLLACETHAHRVIAFSIDADGMLSGPRVFAEGLAIADGLCLDAAGAVWVGSLFAGEFLRVEEGGMITHRVAAPPGQWALAPMLGGAERRTLFMLTADTDPERAQVDDARGFLSRVEVEVPGAGWP
jgi:sugar lactone lactonase YvrE